MYFGDIAVLADTVWQDGGEPNAVSHEHLLMSWFLAFGKNKPIKIYEEK